VFTELAYALGVGLGIGLAAGAAGAAGWKVLINDGPNVRSMLIADSTFKPAAGGAWPGALVAC
jgi:hypothetical protein